MARTKQSFQSANQLIEHISNFNGKWSGQEWQHWTISPDTGYVKHYYYSRTYFAPTETLDPSYNGKVVKVKSVYYVLTYITAYDISHLHLSEI